MQPVSREDDLVIRLTREQAEHVLLELNRWAYFRLHQLTEHGPLHPLVQEHNYRHLRSTAAASQALTDALVQATPAPDILPEGTS